MKLGITSLAKQILSDEAKISNKRKQGVAILLSLPLFFPHVQHTPIVSSICHYTSVIHSQATKVGGKQKYTNLQQCLPKLDVNILKRVIASLEVYSADMLAHL